MNAPFWGISYYDKCKRCKGMYICHVFLSVVILNPFSLPTCGVIPVSSRSKKLSFRVQEGPKLISNQPVVWLIPLQPCSN